MGTQQESFAVHYFAIDELSVSVRFVLSTVKHRIFFVFWQSFYDNPLPIMVVSSLSGRLAIK
jgi:hypothetical protein